MFYRLLFIIFVGLSSTLLSQQNNQEIPKKCYVDIQNLCFNQNGIYSYSPTNDTLCRLNEIHFDQKGYYYYSSGIPVNTLEGVVRKEKFWQCPYCNYWWRIGQKCNNPDCPTNNW